MNFFIKKGWRGYISCRKMDSYLYDASYCRKYFHDLRRFQL